MAKKPNHREHHLVSRIGWLRAAILGANDGIISTGSLIVGVAAAASSSSQVLVSGSAALVAGAMSMAAGEYASVSSQADTEKADIERESRELERQPEAEHRELAHIYQKRGLDPDLARQVADQLMEKDALEAHAQDELGISEVATARPIRAGLASAASFTAGAAAPLLPVVLAPLAYMVPAVSAACLAYLAVLGLVGARIGGASPLRAAARIGFWGALALAVTAGIGSLLGTAV